MTDTPSWQDRMRYTNLGYHARKPDGSIDLKLVPHRGIRGLGTIIIHEHFRNDFEQAVAAVNPETRDELQTRKAEIIEAIKHGYRLAVYGSSAEIKPVATEVQSLLPKRWPSSMHTYIVRQNASVPVIREMLRLIPGLSGEAQQSTLEFYQAIIPELDAAAQKLAEHIVNRENDWKRSGPLGGSRSDMLPVKR